MVWFGHPVSAHCRKNFKKGVLASVAQPEHMYLNILNNWLAFVGICSGLKEFDSRLAPPMVGPAEPHQPHRALLLYCLCQSKLTSPIITGPVIIGRRKGESVGFLGPTPLSGDPTLSRVLRGYTMTVQRISALFQGVFYIFLSTIVNCWDFGLDKDLSKSRCNSKFLLATRNV